MCKALNYTQKIISTLEEATEEYKRLEIIVHKFDRRTQDLLHQIELNDVGNMYDAWKIIKELKEVRQLRRKAKDEIQYLDVIKDFQHSQEKKYQKILNMIQLKQAKMDRRTYYIRVNDPMELKKICI